MNILALLPLLVKPQKSEPSQRQKAIETYTFTSYIPVIVTATRTSAFTTIFSTFTSTETIGSIITSGRCLRAAYYENTILDTEYVNTDTDTLYIVAERVSEDSDFITTMTFTSTFTELPDSRIVIVLSYWTSTSTISPTVITMTSTETAPEGTTITTRTTTTTTTTDSSTTTDTKTVSICFQETERPPKRKCCKCCKRKTCDTVNYRPGCPGGSGGNCPVGVCPGVPIGNCNSGNGNGGVCNRGPCQNQDCKKGVCQDSDCQHENCNKKNCNKEEPPKECLPGDEDNNGEDNNGGCSCEECAGNNGILSDEEENIQQGDTPSPENITYTLDKSEITKTTASSSSNKSSSKSSTTTTSSSWNSKSFLFAVSLVLIACFLGSN
eukprot:GHVP01068601.1.p1 GENE.GHVP01068601.1~~GHVP01068601.1.p1  ORF type:complete len:381 (+),score=54.40 GHVP01068601.1:171-1313(+)